MLIKLQKKGTYLPVKNTITVYDRNRDNVKYKESLFGETQKKEKYTVSAEIISEIKEIIAKKDRLLSIKKIKGADDILDGDIWKLIIMKEGIEYKLKAYSPWAVDENHNNHTKEELIDIQLFVSMFEDIENILIEDGCKLGEEDGNEE